MQIRELSHALLALLLVTACSKSSPAVDATRNPDKGWVLVKSIEKPNTHYVLVVPNRWEEPGIYRDAVKTLCKPKEYCAVNFWKDPEMVPDTYPPTLAQDRAKIPVGANYMKTGKIRVLFLCKVVPKPCPKISALDTTE